MKKHLGIEEIQDLLIFIGGDQLLAFVSRSYLRHIFTYNNVTISKSTLAEVNSFEVNNQWGSPGRCPTINLFNFDFNFFTPFEVT